MEPSLLSRAQSGARLGVWELPPLLTPTEAAAVISPTLTVRDLDVGRFVERGMAVQLGPRTTRFTREAVAGIRDDFELIWMHVMHPMFLRASAARVRRDPSARNLNLHHGWACAKRKLDLDLERDPDLRADVESARRSTLQTLGDALPEHSFDSTLLSVMTAFERAWEDLHGRTVRRR